MNLIEQFIKLLKKIAQANEAIAESYARMYYHKKYHCYASHMQW